MGGLRDAAVRPAAGGLIEAAGAMAEWLVRIRRAVHADPELGFQERTTRALVLAELERIAPDASARDIARTGVLLTLGTARPRILLRACLDALPVAEETGASYASTTPGVSHACGHDAQVAVLLGAVALLARLDPVPSVTALFQPAEELDTGARAVLTDGLLDLVEPDAVVGFHGHPGLPAGAVGLRAGPVMGSITTIRCRLEGRAGHGAEPHLTDDVVTAAASLVLDWQVALARRIDPRQPVVLSIGRVAAGTANNVIPRTAEIEGTVRSVDPEIEPAVWGILADVARAVEIRSGARVELETDLVVPAVVNDPSVTGRAADAVAALLGRDALVEAEPTLGGDDFAWYLRHAPGCYVFVGERQEGRDPYGWHDPAYDLDERSLQVGSATLAAIVLELANGGIR